VRTSVDRGKKKKKTFQQSLPNWILWNALIRYPDVHSSQGFGIAASAGWNNSGKKPVAMCAGWVRRIHFT